MSATDKPAPSRARATYATREEKLALVGRICERIRGGTHVNHACALEWLHKRRLYEWIADDEEVFVLVSAARAEAAESMRSRVLVAADGGLSKEVSPPNANVLLHLLERSHPDEYAPPKQRIEQEVSGKDGAPLFRPPASEEEALERIKALEQRLKGPK